MCDIQNPASTGDEPDRRTFLKRGTVATVAALLGANLGGNVAYADVLTREQRDMMTPDQIIALMRQGNERFRAGQRKDRNFLREQQASAKGQYPAAVVLSCVDSRVPAEIIMDLGIGDIFNSRVAGNIADQDILGSM
jgi:carbonic anhydrase